MITEAAGLDALPVGNVVLDPSGRAHQKFSDGKWWRTFDVNPTLGGRTADRVLRYGPVQVLYRWGDDPAAREPRPGRYQAVIDAAGEVVGKHGLPGAIARRNALEEALDALGPRLTVVVAAARWTDRYGRAGAGEALSALFNAVEGADR